MDLWKILSLHVYFQECTGATVVVIEWQLDLQLPVQ